MNTKSLECFAAVVESGSLKAAAQEMGMTEAAVSKCLASLADGVGTPLFRRGRKLYLTEAGQRYAETARQILEIKRNTYNLIFSSGTEESERYAIGVSPHMGANIFQSVYDRFHAERPQIKIDAHEGHFKDNMRLLEKGQIDLVLGLEDASFTRTGRITFWPVVHGEWLLGVVESHPIAKEGAVSGVGVMPKKSLAAFQDIPFIGMSERTYSQTLQLELAQQAGFVPLTVYNTSNVNLSRNMARILGGYCFLPRDSCISGAGLRYYSSVPACNITSGFYFRDGLALSESLSCFLALSAQQMLCSDFLGPEDCASPELREIIQRFGGMNHV